MPEAMYFGLFYAVPVMAPLGISRKSMCFDK